MNIAETLFGHLTANAAVAEWIDSRCYPIRLPQEPVLPAITYQRIDAPRIVTHSGGGALVASRFQISCWAATYAEAIELAERVKAAFGNWHRAYGGTAIVQTQADLYEPDTGVYHVPVDVILWYRE